MKGSLGAVVKLLPCDHEVMGSSPGNSLLQKCRERLRTIDPKWSDPSLDPAQAGATCTRLPFFIDIKFRIGLHIHQVQNRIIQHLSMPHIYHFKS